MKFLSEILFYVYFLTKNSWKDIHTQFIKNNRSVIVGFDLNATIQIWKLKTSSSILAIH